MTALDTAFNVGDTQADIKSERNQLFYPCSLALLFEECKHFPTAILKDVGIGVWFFF